MKSIGYIIIALLLLTLIHRGNSQTADDIVNSYISAVGGMDKINSIRTVKLYEKVPRRGVYVSLIETIKRPDKVRTEVFMQGQSMVRAFDGSIAWGNNPFRGNKEGEKMNEEDTKSMREEAQFEGPLVNYREKGNSVESLGKDDFEGTDVYKLKLTNKDGDKIIYYVDTGLYLILKQVTKRKIKEKEISTETVYGDYRPEDGFIMPHSLETKPEGSRGDSQKITIEKVEFNIPVDDSIFKMPGSK
jgi:outer membrane lipoprotein-sorting protein